MVNDVNTEYQMFESDELDMTEIPSDMAEQLIDGDNVVIEDQGGVYFYRFNVNMEPFQNEKSGKHLHWPSIRKTSSIMSRKQGKAAKAFVSPGFTGPSGKDFREVNGDLVNFDPEKQSSCWKKAWKKKGMTNCHK